jgi:hypothetical protein
MQALAKSKTITARWLELSLGVRAETFLRVTVRSNNHSVVSMQPAKNSLKQKDILFTVHPTGFSDPQSSGKMLTIR